MVLHVLPHSIEPIPSFASPPPTTPDKAMCTNILFIILISCSSMSNHSVSQNTSYRRRFNYFPDVSPGNPSGDGRLGGPFIVYVWLIKWFRQLYNYNCRLSCQSSAAQGDDQNVILIYLSRETYSFELNTGVAFWAINNDETQSENVRERG